MKKIFYIRSTLASLARRLSQTFFHYSDDPDMQRYLSKSTDIHDLEARQQAWDKRGNYLNH